MEGMECCTKRERFFGSRPELSEIYPDMTEIAMLHRGNSIKDDERIFLLLLFPVAAFRFFYHVAERSSRSF